MTLFLILDFLFIGYLYFSAYHFSHIMFRIVISVLSLFIYHEFDIHVILFQSIK